MQPELETKLQALEEKIDALYASAEKTRKYLLIIIWVTILAVVAPAIGLFFAIPAFLNTYMSSFDGLL